MEDCQTAIARIEDSYRTRIGRQQAEEDVYAPLKAQIDAAVQKVGTEKGLAFILNTDKGAVPYVSAACAENVTLLIKESLK